MNNIKYRRRCSICDVEWNSTDKENSCWLCGRPGLRTLDLDTLHFRAREETRENYGQ